MGMKVRANLAFRESSPQHRMRQRVFQPPDPSQLPAAARQPGHATAINPTAVLHPIKSNIEWFKRYVVRSGQGLVHGVRGNRPPKLPKLFQGDMQSRRWHGRRTPWARRKLQPVQQAKCPLSHMARRTNEKVQIVALQHAIPRSEDQILNQNTV